MDYRILGRTGVKVSPLCLGTMNFGGRTSPADFQKILDQYLRTGRQLHRHRQRLQRRQIREEIVGDWLKDRSKRDQIVLSPPKSMVAITSSQNINDAGNHRWHIVREVENSLKRLKAEPHRCHITFTGPTPTPQSIKPSARLDDLVRQGRKVHSTSPSSVFAAWQLAEAHFIARRTGNPPGSMLSSRSLILRLTGGSNRRFPPFCRKYEIATITWAPLARGRLTGAYHTRRAEDSGWHLVQGTGERLNFPASQWPLMEAVDKLADGHRISSSQFAIAWCACRLPGGDLHRSS